MFKYKSPLSRLLEGSAKHANNDKSHEDECDTAEDEPIADLHALRQVLAGGNETDELDTDEFENELEGELEATVKDDVRADDIAPLQVEDLPVADTQTLAVENVPTADDESDAIVSTILAEELPGRYPSAEPLETPEFEAPTEPEAIEAPAAKVEAEVEAKQAPAAAVEVEAAPVPEAEPEPAPTATPAPAVARSERVKTTFLGFERPDSHVQESMEAAPVSKQVVTQNSFPVGWLVVTQGPGRGTSFALVEGLAQIGRNDDQAVQLDFGDNGISRAGHAVVAYNAEDRSCYLGHGGKANLVRLNGGPVLSTVPLSNGDMIRISETTLRFVAFCDDGFDWQDS
jgi:hypothetical protein